MIARLRRYFPFLAFIGGFLWDALTIGQRVRPLDFWRLGLFLFGAALLIVWMARRTLVPASAEAGEGRWARLRQVLPLLPYLLLQFFFGGLFSALFILYFKSAGHLGSWLTAGLLGGLLIANEFARERYARRLSLTWTLFGLNAIFLCNFALPHLLGRVEAYWLVLSTLLGAGATHLLWQFGARRHGRILPVWLLAGAVLGAAQFGMIAPVPLVLKQLAIGHDFAVTGGHYTLSVPPASPWQPWRMQDDTLYVPPGEKLYGVSAVYAPTGVQSSLEHRWELRDGSGWRIVARSRFAATGGREGGFRGYSWVNDPSAGRWRFVVATQDGRTIAQQGFHVVREPSTGPREIRTF